MGIKEFHCIFVGIGRSRTGNFIVTAPGFTEPRYIIFNICCRTSTRTVFGPVNSDLISRNKSTPTGSRRQIKKCCACPFALLFREVAGLCPGQGQRELPRGWYDSFHEHILYWPWTAPTCHTRHQTGLRQQTPKSPLSNHRVEPCLWRRPPPAKLKSGANTLRIPLSNPARARLYRMFQVEHR